MSRNTDIIVRQQTPRRGRGALSNHGSRFNPTQVDWDDGVESPAPQTEYRAVTARSIISRNTSPDIPFYQSINPYQGRDYDSRFGHRMRGTGPFAQLLQQRFSLSCKKLGLNIGESPASRSDLFRVPPQAGEQFGLF